MADDDLMTVAEVAGLLKLNRQTLYNWIADGTLAHTRVGRGFRIRREDYELLTGAGGSDPAEADLLTVAGGRAAADRQPADGPQLDLIRNSGLDPLCGLRGYVDWGVGAVWGWRWAVGWFG